MLNHSLDELSPNRSTLNDLGASALYLIATLPEEDQQTQLNRIENIKKEHFRSFVLNVIATRIIPQKEPL